MRPRSIAPVERGALRRRALLALAFGLALGLALPALAGRHPRLVSAEAAKCSTCHAKLLQGTAVVHPPATDDCTNCHEVQISEEGTTIGLVDQEPSLCLQCHDDKEKAAGQKLSAPHEPVGDSCLSCHNPHSSDQKKLLNEPVPALCFECHDLGDLQPLHGGQLGEATDCLRCHAPHGSDNPHALRASHLHPPFAEGDCSGCHREPFGGHPRFKRRGNELCEACHGSKAEPDAVSVHPALEGDRHRAGCLSCHDPHMSNQAKLLVASAPGLCAPCHPKVVAGATGDHGHPPAADDCLTCHQPHSSKQPKLLVEQPPALCLQCHDGEDPDLVKAHLGAPIATRDCTKCHTPHGNGNEHQLATHVHPAILEGCDTCHQGSYDKLLEDGTSALCTACHDDIRELAEKSPVPHPALEAADCTACHNPHASPQPKLLVAPRGGECLECHDDKAAEPGEHQHDAITVVGCRACHEPHGSQNEHLLRLVGNDLCLSCHDPARVEMPKDGSGPARVQGRFDVPVAEARRMTSLRLDKDSKRGHPIPGHLVDGEIDPKTLRKVETTFQGELGCLSCHDPHKSPSDKLFARGAKSSMELCASCHPK